MFTVDVNGWQVLTWDWMSGVRRSYKGKEEKPRRLMRGFSTDIFERSHVKHRKSGKGVIALISHVQ